MYAIMNKELDAYSHGPTWEKGIVDEYEMHRAAILAPDHWMYGSKLVHLRRVKSGIDFKIRFSWRHLIKTPRCSWKYAHYFSWLFVSVWLDFDYGWKVDKILKDYLKIELEE